MRYVHHQNLNKIDLKYIDIYALLHLEKGERWPSLYLSWRLSTAVTFIKIYHDCDIVYSIYCHIGRKYCANGP